MTIDPVGRRPGRRRHAPGPGRRGGQRRAAGVARDRRGEDGGRDRRPAPAGDVGRRTRARPSDRAGRPAHRSLRPPARASAPRPPSASPTTCSARPTTEARSLAAALVAVRDQVVFCEQLLQHQRRAALRDLLRSRPRPAPPVRGRGAARRPRSRADRRVQGPLPRPPWGDLADRRHRARPAADPRAPRPRRRGASAAG